LAKTAHRLEDGGADGLHIDMVDGHYVPNMSMGPKIISDLRQITILPLHVHLMVTNPENYLEALAISGATSITLPSEQNDKNLRNLLRIVRSLSCSAGLSITPHSSTESVSILLDEINQLLITSIYPGSSGQVFMPECIQKIRFFSKKVPEIIVEGGVNDQNITSIKEAGATGIVSANYIFRHQDYSSAIQSMKQA
jgi:ribulose-phosphate 3-epimerase